MKKTTSQKLSERLGQYGVLSLAIAGVADVNGQIVYTDIADTGGGNTFYQLNLDGDGTVDYTILNYASAIQVVAPASNYIFYTTSLAPYGFQGFNNNEILGLGTGEYKYPLALNSGYPISSGASVWVNDADFQTMNWNSCNYTNSQWCGVTDKYLGLRFDIGGNTHYGWARLDVPLSSGGWLIKDYAYNSTPNAPINAGQTVLGVDDNVFSKIKVVALNKSIVLYNLPSTARYNVYNMTGQEVLKGTTDQRDYVIETPALASGVYVVELEDTGSNAVIRKKIVLQ